MALTMQFTEQLINIVFSILAMQFLKRIDQKEPSFLFVLRSIYIVSFSLNILLLYILKRRIESKKDERTLKIKKVRSFFSQNEDDEDEEVEVTYYNYDMDEYMKISKGLMLQFFFIAISHFKFSLCQPLVVQSILPIKWLLLNPLFVEHLLRREMLRPFDKNLLFAKNDENKKAADKVVEKKKKED